jgi:hypothetical protein
MIIAILEDNEDRKVAMGSCVAERLYPYEAHFFDNPATMIAFLASHWGDLLVIALDHDLELLPGPSGKLIDPGTGREVADYLATRAPVCPVVIHSSNSTAAVGMEMVLRDAGWKTYRVLPFEDVTWIPREWIRAVKRAARIGRKIGTTESDGNKPPCRSPIANPHGPKIR